MPPCHGYAVNRARAAGAGLSQCWRVPLTVQQMSNREDGVLPEHPRSSIAHHQAHLFPPLRLITMNRAIRTGRFLIGEPASFEAEGGVIQQVLTFQAQTVIGLMIILTVTRDHRPNCFMLTLQTRRTTEAVLCLRLASWNLDFN
jgi:hypothetical protein